MSSQNDAGDIAEILENIKKFISESDECMNATGKSHELHASRHDKQYAGRYRHDEMMHDFYQMMELIKLFLISERDSYYGYFLMNMRVNADTDTDCIAGIRLNEFPPVLDTNPMLLCRFSIKEILYILCHEIDHIVFEHPTEMVRANPENDPDTAYKFNLAADAAVNDRLDHEIKNEGHDFMARPDDVITSDVLSRMFRLGKIAYMENYAYYFGLIKNKRIRRPDDQRFEQQISAGAFEKMNDHKWYCDEEAPDVDEVAASVREFVNASADMMNDENKGMMPGYFLSQVKQINEPPVISWQNILKKYTGTITAGKVKTKRRLNRRQPERFDLSGSVDDKVIKLAVAIDTSASLDDSSLAKIFNEIFSIISRYRYEVTVIECDSEIQRVYVVHDPSDVKMNVAGRGGTMFTPVIEYINKDRYFRDALLIYFTDGFGETEIPRPSTYRNLWVIDGNTEDLSIKEPYGAVISI